MPLILRPGRPEDATSCGVICYEAFKTIAAQHNFPAGYPSPEVAVAHMVERLTHPGLYAVVAELDGRIVGSNFLDERCPIAGLGPITVAPTAQNRSIGRHLMQDVLDRVTTRRHPGVRLVHASYQLLRLYDSPNAPAPAWRHSDVNAVSTWRLYTHHLGWPWRHVAVGA